MPSPVGGVQLCCSKRNHVDVEPVHETAAMTKYLNEYHQREKENDDLQQIV